jgi:hypothetical protein
LSEAPGETTSSLSTTMYLFAKGFSTLLNLALGFRGVCAAGLRIVELIMFLLDVVGIDNSKRTKMLKAMK